jgi:hypothetical protein
MNRTIRAIRRSIRAARNAGRALVTAARGRHFGLLVALYRAIDTGADVRITYQDVNGTVSERTITPLRFQVSAVGRIVTRAFDHRDQEDTSFRTDRMTLNAEENPVTVTPTHPLLARLPEAHGYLVQVVPVGAGVVVAEATPDSRDGAYQVTAYRPLLGWELEAAQADFPGETGLPTVDYEVAGILQDAAGVDAGVSWATARLAARLEHDAASEAA